MGRFRRAVPRAAFRTPAGHHGARSRGARGVGHDCLQRLQPARAAFRGAKGEGFRDGRAPGLRGAGSGGALLEEAEMGLVLVPGSVGTAAGERASAATEAAVDGFVVYSVADDDPLVEAALRRRLPVVIADQPLLEGVPFVGIDDERVAREVTEHLLGFGHERFGVVSFSLAGPEGPQGFADESRRGSATLRVTRTRLEGYGAALEAAGLSWREVPVYECYGSSEALGREGAGAL